MSAADLDLPALLARWINNRLERHRVEQIIGAVGPDVPCRCRDCKMVLDLRRVHAALLAVQAQRDQAVQELRARLIDVDRIRAKEDACPSVSPVGALPCDQPADHPGDHAAPYGTPHPPEPQAVVTWPASRLDV